MAVNVSLGSENHYNQFELLAWLNESLQTKFTKVEQICSGAAFCQLMDWLFPGSVKLERVKFQAQTEVEFIYNYGLLQASFRHTGITESLSVEELISGNFENCLTFLKWFKLLFEANYHGQKYDALEARQGQMILPAKCASASPQIAKTVSLSHCRTDLTTGSESDSDGHKKDRRRKPAVFLDAWLNKFSWLSRSTLGDYYGHCKLCEISLNISYRGSMDLKRHEQSHRHSQNVDKTGLPQAAKTGEQEAADASPFNENMLRFLEQHCRSKGRKGKMSQQTAKALFGLDFPKDIVSICCQTPYCVYLCHGVEVGQESTVSLVLVGFFDEKTDKNCIRLLDVIQPPQGDEAAVFTSLIETLNKFSISLSNFVTFYTDANAAVSQELVLHLRKINPRVVSLSSLFVLADHACQSGLKALPSQVEELVMSIHEHYSTCPTTNDNLKEIFVSTGASGSSSPISAQCLVLGNVIKKFLDMWPDLISYFKSCSGENDKAEQICSQLENPRLRLTFMFLSHALERLCTYQRKLNRSGESSKVELAEILQEVRSLLQLYAASFLNPEAVEKFLSSCNINILKDKVYHLPEAEMDVGASAREFLAQSENAVTDTMRSFTEDVVAFYTALLGSIAGNLPFGDSNLKTITLILKPTGKWNLTDKMVADLGSKFGLCKTLEEEKQLMNELSDCPALNGGTEPPAESKNPSSGHGWGTILRTMGQTSILRKLILAILALPCPPMEPVDTFLHVLEGGNLERVGEANAVCDLTDDSSISLDVEIVSSSVSNNKTCAPSDVIDLTDGELTATAPSQGSEKPANKASEPIIIDDDVICTNTSSQEVKQNNTSTPNRPSKKTFPYLDGKGFEVGEMVWGQVEGFSLWPALVVGWRSKQVPPDMRMVEWFGDGLLSEIHIKGLQSFAAFAKCFCANSFATLPIYKDAIYCCLELAAERCRKTFNVGTREAQLKLMLDWAFGGFKPSGPDPLKRPLQIDDDIKNLSPVPKNQDSDHKKQENCPKKQESGLKKQENCPKKQDSGQKKQEVGHIKPESPHTRREATDQRRCSTNGKQDSAHLRQGSSSRRQESSFNVKPESLTRKHDSVNKMQENTDSGKQDLVNEKAEMSDSAACEPPPKKLKPIIRSKEPSRAYSSMTIQERHFGREQMVQKVLKKGKKIEEFCLSCGTMEIEIFHPLFEGSLCTRCKDNFTETLYRYDEDGYQSYCTVCCAGLEVVLCGNSNCCRSYCVDCLNILVGPGTFDKLTEVDPWSCYLCIPSHRYGVLKSRVDWSVRVQAFFANNSAMEFEPHRVYPSIPANQRRPLKVLSLFDGIATGYLVLKDLGFKVDLYVASEICEDSIAVGKINHEGKIVHVNDARTITKKHVADWGPFDLLIGGSPCNDLSIVNPARKEGTGRLFFEYYRLLNILKPKEGDRRPFFWLFENVVAMNHRDKEDICRFLECNPILIDAVKVSPAHRARYFWGNLPGMDRPIIPSLNDKVDLQQCLEIGRQAKFTKVRTITTASNSLKQGKTEISPVVMNGRDDILWITEMEKNHTSDFS
ncbi:hypothetical protein GJAV_G00184660 [Gymnothorax javanicus]|nr:hypothetical protein GJAV_G00184660 [Gymnothorax javanicus]